MTDRYEALRKAAKEATPQDLDSAKSVHYFEDGSFIGCPMCGGDGDVELTADFCNYDSKAIGVQFYGIGPEHKAAEAYFRLANPAAILELLADRDAWKARFEGMEEERERECQRKTDALLALQAVNEKRDALAAQVEALKVDAERYRLLCISEEARENYGAHFGMAKPIIDSSIDAARKEQS